MPADLPTGLSESPGILSAAAASHASNAQNEYLNSNDEEEAVVDFVNTNLEFDDVNEDDVAGREGDGIHNQEGSKCDGGVANARPCR